jgi:hypothetical protein
MIAHHAVGDNKLKACGITNSTLRVVSPEAIAILGKVKRF